MDNLTTDTVLDCTHLSVQQDGEEFTVGDPATGEFIRVPEVAVDVVRGFDGKKTIAEVKQEVEAKYGEDVDVLDFAETLIEMELVLKINGEVINEEIEREVNPKLQKLGSFFYNPVAVGFYGLATVSAIILFLVQPQLFPTFRDVFLFESVGLSSLIILFTMAVLTIVHEIGHALAASRLGIKTKIQLNLRMVFLVAETDMSGLWSRERKERYLPYFAGMAWDGAILFFCLIIQILFPVASVMAIGQMITFFILYNILGQFIFFLRTDVYFIITNWVNTSALHQHSIIFLQNLFLKRNQDEWSRLAAHEQKHAKWFSGLYTVGGALAIFLFGYFQIPPVVYMIQQAYGHLTTEAVTNAYFWDGVIVMGVLAIQVLLWLFGLRTAMRERQASQAVSA
ncbi:PqqD family protein [Pontibacillus salipaludis]|uniref:PqqD family protein n=1 Tax=Pontibacillus salipaludis TaxID=1697394 RepID=UPI0031F160D4